MSKIRAKVTLFLHIRKKKCNFAAKLYSFIKILYPNPKYNL
jgi:hypothetical protein